MDTHELDYWVQCTRLRSARHKKRMQRKGEDKQLLQKHREELDIWAALRKLEWIDLKPPVQRGFIRYFVLRSDLSRSRDASFFKGILDKINTTHWSHRKDFKKKTKRFGKKIYRVREQRLDDVSADEFLKKFNEKERAYFDEHMVHRGKCNRLFKVYRFTETWMFVLKVEPNMITKVRVHNIDLAKRSAELDKFFTHKRRNRLRKISGGTYHEHVWPDKKFRSPFLCKSFSSILDDYWPDPQTDATCKTLGNPGVLSFLDQRCVNGFGGWPELSSMTSVPFARNQITQSSITTCGAFDHLLILSVVRILNKGFVPPNSPECLLNTTVTMRWWRIT